MSVTDKVKYWSREIPDGPWDYIIIGSGMGGMTAAALLSKMGRRVLVIEQHIIPGGFTKRSSALAITGTSECTLLER